MRPSSAVVSPPGARVLLVVVASPPGARVPPVLVVVFVVFLPEVVSTGMGAEIDGKWLGEGMAGMAGKTTKAARSADRQLT